MRSKINTAHTPHVFNKGAKQVAEQERDLVRANLHGILFACEEILTGVDVQLVKEIASKRLKEIGVK